MVNNIKSVLIQGVFGKGEIMNLKDIWDKYKKIILLGLFIIILAVSLVFGYSPSKNYVTKMIGNFIKEQNDIIMNDYISKIEIYEAEIKELKKKNVASDKKIREINNKIGVLENDIDKNKVPVSSDEMRERFHKLGYYPIN